MPLEFVVVVSVFQGVVYAATFAGYIVASFVVLLDCLYILWASPFFESFGSIWYITVLLQVVVGELLDGLWCGILLIRSVFRLLPPHLWVAVLLIHFVGCWAEVWSWIILVDAYCDLLAGFLVVA